jgi:hypothetical protein
MAHEDTDVNIKFTISFSREMGKTLVPGYASANGTPLFRTNHISGRKLLD